MKKLLAISIVATLIAAPTVANAATKVHTGKKVHVSMKIKKASPKPSISAAGSGEGTAAHEQGESSSTQNAEAKKSGKKMSKKKVVKKK